MSPLYFKFFSQLYQCVAMCFVVLTRMLRFICAFMYSVHCGNIIQSYFQPFVVVYMSQSFISFVDFVCWFPCFVSFLHRLVRWFASWLHFFFFCLSLFEVFCVYRAVYIPAIECLTRQPPLRTRPQSPYNGQENCDLRRYERAHSMRNICFSLKIK